MVDGFRLSKYYRETGLSMEEFWYLYQIFLQEPNVAAGILKVIPEELHKATAEFSKNSKHYLENAKIAGKPIDRRAMLFDLESRGFIEIWTKDLEAEIKLSDVKVTDKFKDSFLIDDVSDAFKEFLAIYPKMVYIAKTNSYFPTANKSLTALAREYNELILKGGNMWNHQRCLLITEKYLEIQGNKKFANYNITNYFINFEGIATALEQGDDDLPTSGTINIYDDV